MPIDKRVRQTLLFVVPLCFLGLNGWFFYSNFLHLMDASNWLRQTLRVQQDLTRIEAEMTNAETGQRGFLLTSDELYLAPYHRADVQVESTMERLRGFLGQDLRRLSMLREAEELIQKKFEEMAQTVEAHKRGGADASGPLVRENRGKAIMDRLRRVIDELHAVESTALFAREATYDSARNVTVASFAALAATVLVLIGGVFILTRREVRNRSQAAARISEQARSLEQTVETLESRRAEIAMLNEAGSFLQSCARISEVAELAGRFLEQMFPETDGTLYIYASSRNRLHAVSRWGKAELGDHVDPLECWSLRRGLTHAYRADSAAPRCHHHGGHGDTLCVPLLAHGEAIGLLALQASGPAMLSEAIHRRADLLAHQLGPVLANIKLRETLNEQSIRDPLTNAFNRRYLDVVAEKEMAQAKRHGSGIAVAMIDVDHFKRFNDMHGHLAGDVALAGVVSHLQQSMRGEDWLFRYGGEEFLVLMRNVTVPEAELRLGQLVAGVRDVQLQIDGRALPGVTISAGLAGFPNHSTDFAELVTMADEALYCAKRAGRNQLCVAPVPDQNPLRLSA